MTEGAPTLRVGMVGYAFMGAVHSQAWRTAGRFFDLPYAPALSVLCGRDAEQVAKAATRMGWASTEQDWLVDDAFPLVWRLQRDRAGSGALGDLGAHIVDMAQYVSGWPITGVSGLAETFVRERPLPTQSSGLAASAGTNGSGPVTVDDAVLFIARFDSGAVGSFEATRFASG